MCDAGFFACARGGCCDAASPAQPGVLTTSATLNRVSFELDARDLPHVAFVGDAQAGVQYATWESGAWATQSLEAPGLGGTAPSLALDQRGYPHVAFYDSLNKDLKYAAWTGSAFDVAAVDTPGDVGLCVSLRVDASGKPHIAYHDVTQKQLKYARFDGATWSISTVDSTSDECSISLALDSQQNARIAYKKDVTDLFFASFDGTTWSTQFVYAPPSVNFQSRYGAYHNALRLDSQGHAHILTHDYTTAFLPSHRIQYVRWDGTQWVRRQLTSGNRAGGNQLVLDAQDRAHTTAHLGQAKQLTYRRLLASGDTEAGTMFSMSASLFHDLALDRAQHPHIVSTHEVNAGVELRYARYDGTEWLE